MQNNILIVGKNDYAVTTDPSVAGDITGYSPCVADIVFLVNVLQKIDGVAVDVAFADFSNTYDVDNDNLDAVFGDGPKPTACMAWKSIVDLAEFDYFGPYSLIVCYDLEVVERLRKVHPTAKFLYRSMYDDCSPRGGFYSADIEKKLSLVDAIAVGSEFAKNWFFERFVAYGKTPVDSRKVFVWHFGFSQEDVNNTFSAIALARNDVIDSDDEQKLIITMSNLASIEQISVVVKALNKIVERSPYSIALYLMRPQCDLHIKNKGFDIKFRPSLRDNRQEVLACADLFVSMWKPMFSGGDFYAAEAAELGCNVVAAKTPEWFDKFTAFSFLGPKEFEASLSNAIEFTLRATPVGSRMDVANSVVEELKKIDQLCVELLGDKVITDIKSI